MISVAFLATSALAHGNHDQAVIAGPHKVRLQFLLPRLY